MQDNIFERLENFKRVKRDSVQESSSGRIQTVQLLSDKRRIFALKIVPKKSEKEDHFSINEFNIHKGLSHPNIIKLHHALEGKNNFYFFLDFASEGNLMQALSRNTLSREQMIKVFYQVCVAVEFMHDRNFLHLDLRPENILLDQDLNAKLSGFGLSRECHGGFVRKSLSGPLAYLAPERIMRKPVNQAVDVWALGVILY